MGPCLFVHVARGTTYGAVPGDIEEPPPRKLRAIIDTGASHTFIPQGTAAMLGIPAPIRTERAFTASEESVPYKAYRVRIAFPLEGFFVQCTALEGIIRVPDVDCLIGRDVLRHGRFIYDGVGNERWWFGLGNQPPLPEI